MEISANLVSFVVFLSSVVTLHAVELTFELQDRDTQCFYEEIKKGEQSTVEFQVRSVMANSRVR